MKFLLEERFEDNETLQAMKEVANRYGYYFEGANRGYKSNPNKLYPFIRVSRKDRNGYLPEIYFEDDLNDDYEYKIQTTSYGALNEEEFADFLNAQTKAYSLIQKLQNFDISKLPIIDE